MHKDVFVLRYRDGSFVQRDDSTGPMSTGGYPFPVKTLEEATFFDTAADAAHYATVGSWRDMERKVYPLKITYELDEGVAIEYPEKWTECNRNCVKTPESTAKDATHYLDCPIWEFNRR